MLGSCEVTPKLDAFSLVAFSRFRSELRVPDARHWEAFLAFVQGVAPLSETPLKQSFAIYPGAPNLSTA